MTTSVSPTGSTGPFVPLAQPGLTAPPRGATRSLPTAAAGLQAASSQTLATVTQVAKAARSSRSAGAADRLKQLLMMIKVLCLVGGDPKTVAHRAAQLAKEISAAAKTCTTAVDDSPAPTEGEGTASAGECDQAAGTPAAPPQVAADVNQAQATAQAAATAAGTTDCATPPSPGTPSPGASSPGPSSNADTDPTTAATTPKDGPNGGTGDTGEADTMVKTVPWVQFRWCSMLL